MSISDKELEYDHHIGFYKSMGLLTGAQERDSYYIFQAQHTHALNVSDAIRDAHINAVMLSNRIDNRDAVFHLRHGVARRTKFIWLALRRLMALAYPDRKEPMPMDDVEEVAGNLNTIYINIRGTLDNFAWSLRDILGGDSCRRLAPIKVHLFGKEFLSDKGMGDVATLMSEFSDWNKELSSRRDPSAHRIPLSVPPAVLDAATSEEYSRRLAQYNDVLNAAASEVQKTGNLEGFEKAELLFDELQRVGRFLPVFVHHPDEGAIRIYPTVPQDIAQVVKIARGLTNIISKKAEG